jgi:hypothetical protein
MARIDTHLELEESAVVFGGLAPLDGPLTRCDSTRRTHLVPILDGSCCRRPAIDATGNFRRIRFTVYHVVYLMA